MDEFSEALVRMMACRCGLMDPDAFEEQVYAKSWEEGTFPGQHQRTGRTTRMLLQALVALKCGATVEIVAADRRHAERLRARLYVLVQAANVDRTSIADRLRFRWAGSFYDHRQAAADVRLVDHAVILPGERAVIHSVHDGIGKIEGPAVKRSPAPPSVDPHEPAADLWDCESVREAAGEVLQWYRDRGLASPEPDAQVIERAATALACYVEWKLRPSLEDIGIEESERWTRE